VTFANSSPRFTLGRLGQTVCAVGRIRTGGSYTATGDALELRPDRAPGTVYRLVNGGRRDTVGDIIGYRGQSGRVAVEGPLLSDGTIPISGFGLMGPNETWGGRDTLEAIAAGMNAMQNLDGVWVPYPEAGGIARWDLAGDTDAPLCLGNPSGNGNTATDDGDQPPPPPPDWSGEQAASIVWNAASRTLTVYGADGVTYTGVEGASDPAAWESITTTAPQGQRLLITGDWSPGDGTVSVDSWVIEATGDQDYGIDPDTGGFSDDPEDRPVAHYDDPRFQPPTTNGASGGGQEAPDDSWTPWAAAALLGGFWFLATREREE